LDKKKKKKLAGRQAGGRRWRQEVAGRRISKEGGRNLKRRSSFFVHFLDRKGHHMTRLLNL